MANSAYTASELAHQYTDSEPKTIITTAECFGIVREMFDKVLGLEWEEWKTKVIIIPDSLEWAGGTPSSRLSAPRDIESLLKMEEMLGIDAMVQEEKFDGSLAHETAFMCYSSVRHGLLLTSIMS